MRATRVIVAVLGYAFGAFLLLAVIPMGMIAKGQFIDGYEIGQMGVSFLPDLRVTGPMVYAFLGILILFGLVVIAGTAEICSTGGIGSRDAEGDDQIGP